MTGAAVLPATASAQGELRTVALPVPTAPLSGRPPFPALSRFTIANVFKPPIASRERIGVGVDETGAVVSVRAIQRLRLGTLGDYVLSVPGPVVDVEAGPGSQSQPGLRRGAILWQGFSPGGKVLSASARLDARRARGPLPLRLSMRRAGGAVTLRIHNASEVQLPIATGEGDAVELARILDELHPHPTGQTLGQSFFANVTGVVRKRIPVSAPLRVSGTISAGGPARRFEALLGGGRPLDTVVRVRGDGRPRLVLEAKPVPPVGELRPPAGGSWVESVRRTPRVLTGRRLLDLTWSVLARLARAHQYQNYLANPDPNGAVSASYVFRTVAREAPPPAPSGSSESGLGPLAITLIAVGAVAAAGGLVVLWAHS